MPKGSTLKCRPAAVNGDALWWRLKYRFAGKERCLSLGTYPQVSLKEARIRRAAAKIQLSNG
jgi:hypothetical protein